MPLPDLNKDSLMAAIPGVEHLGDPLAGGQKKVYPCVINGQEYALKVMFPVSPEVIGNEESDANDETLDVIAARALREFEILEQCDSNHLVKVGPLSLERSNVDGVDIIYFAEEWIEGRSLMEIIAQDGSLPAEDVVLLAEQVSEAVQNIWSLQKIHRDIKPGNIMRRESGEFVLLDLGMAFALDESSLTDPGRAPGTMRYFSPEQFDVARKRNLDFRSDLFALGVVMYETATGQHPFWTTGMAAQELAFRIVNLHPAPPATSNGDISPELESIILRLLAKKPHLRYGTIKRFRNALKAV